MASSSSISSLTAMRVVVVARTPLDSVSGALAPPDEAAPLEEAAPVRTHLFFRGPPAALAFGSDALLPRDGQCATPQWGQWVVEAASREPEHPGWRRAEPHSPRPRQRREVPHSLPWWCPARQVPHSCRRPWVQPRKGRQPQE